MSSLNTVALIGGPAVSSLVQVGGVDPTTGNAVPLGISPSGGLSVPPATGPLTDASGTITTGGTAQTAVAALAGRKYLFIQNVSDTDLWVNFGVAAVASQPSCKLTPNTGFIFENSFVPDTYVSVLGATTGKGFTLKQA